MNQKELSELTDQELLEEAKKMKSSPIADAFFIGFLVGIIIYSVVVNSWGFLTLIPLFLVYLLLKKSKRNELLKKELKERNLQKN
ncbi:MAG: FUSC family protein [Bacteroidales bacterium]|nr:FUSC family protein [Bacteroidales bacterium]